MTPRFVQAVDPILLHAFSLLERIDSGDTVSPHEEKRLVEDLIRQGDQRLADDSELQREWSLAKYALVAWMDEMLVDAHIWGGQDWWRENVLEWSLFQSRRCHDMYYVRAAQSVSTHADDALQVFYVCVLLGFRGLYRDPLKTRSLIDKHGLPAELQTWADEYANMVRQARQRHGDSHTGSPSDRTVNTAVPLWNRSLVVWPWLLATIAAGLNALSYFGF